MALDDALGGPDRTSPSGALSSIGEFGLIERIRRSFEGGGASQRIGVDDRHDVATMGVDAAGGLPDGRDAAGAAGIGIGDDAAVIPAGGGLSLLVTTDLLVEGRHFRRDWISPEDLGWKALAVNVSDIAGMGGGHSALPVPMHAFLSLALPSDLSLAWIDGFVAGMNDLCAAHGIRLSGGDTTRSADGVTINITLMAWAESRRILLRSGGRPGDLVCVTGTLGDSGAGLRLLAGEKVKMEAAPALVQRLIQAHHHPRLWLDEARWLAATGAVTSMMDLSDGIESDARHLAIRSGVRCRIRAEALPLSRDLTDLCDRTGWSALDLAASGGEDYGLLFTLNPDQAPSVAASYASRFGSPFTVVGDMTPIPASEDPSSEPLEFSLDGRPWRPSTHGFDHFLNTSPTS